MENIIIAILAIVVFIALIILRATTFFVACAIGFGILIGVIIVAFLAHVAKGFYDIYFN